jgi:DNA-binding HxlR family transcriptional regulator
MKKDWEPFQKMLDLIPKIRGTCRESIESHKKSHVHDFKEISNERKYFQSSLDAIQKKWNIDVLFVINILDKAYYNEIKKCIPEISSRSLSDCLQYLTQKELITREVVDTHPVRVQYQLTDYGKGVYELLLPASFFFVLKGNI